MAEIFAAVASGAGLVSLAIQLLESSQKLKGLYNATKDAPRNVKDLCFDLETLSLQLRQLEKHRQHDHLDTEPLDRCIAQCERRTGNVRDLVDDMARYLRRSAAFGRLYAAFKEPEMERLLDELERAKGSLSLTYISYCQAWNMRNAASHASMLQRHGDILALQQMQLDGIQHDVSDGNSRLYDQLENLKTDCNKIKRPQSFHDKRTHITRSSKKSYASSKTWSSLRFRLPLMAWFADWTWEIAVCQSQASWTLQVHPINYRASESLALRYVRDGNIPAVEKLLREGELSIWDVTMTRYKTQTTLLGVAVEHCRLELCDFLLTHFDPLRTDEQLLGGAKSLRLVDYTLRERYSVELFELFVGKFGMDVDVIDACPQMLSFLQDNFWELSGAILSHQSIDLASWPLQERFRIAMRLENRSPFDFQRTVGLPISEIAQLSDAHLGTALHWAAKEWYLQYSCGSEAVNTTGYRDRKQFVMELLENGALLHALNRRGRTPLTCMLDCSFVKDEGELWIPYYFVYRGCTTLTECWGSLLGDAGVFLPQYVARENALLSARREDGIRLSGTVKRGFELRHFVLSKQQSLQIEVTAVTQMEIWEFQPPPGLFLDSRRDHSTICWPPDFEDGDRTCWQRTSSRKLRSKPFEWTRTHHGDSDEVSIFTAVFNATHDDHSAPALLLSRDRRKRSLENRHRPRRSSSMPPLDTAWVRENPRSLPLRYGLRFGVPGMENIVPLIHRCLLDSQWGFQVPTQSYRYQHSWRACMQGCQGRTDYPSMFEEFLQHTASQPKRMASEMERLGEILGSD